MDERCGNWVKIADVETICMRPFDHDGECVPKRSELMRAIDAHDDNAQEITNYICEKDGYSPENLWPYEGPADERDASA